MFPSGPWRGFYEQPGAGRQWMEPLTLRFTEGRVSGDGSDVVGDFTFAGQYEGGTVQLVKRYRGRHLVHYAGKIDGEGLIVGQWNIGEWSHGPFVLMPSRESAAGLPIAEAVFAE